MENQKKRKGRPAEGSRSKKARGEHSKASTSHETLPVRDTDPATIKSKYMKAFALPSSNVLWPHMVQFSGRFAGSQKEMQDIVKDHGGMIGSKAVFNVLIASPSEYDTETNKVQRAKREHIPIIHEMYLYDAIIDGRQPDINRYDLSNCEGTLIRAVPSSAEEEEEEEEDVTDETRLRDTDPAQVSSKYRKALAKPTSNVMRRHKVQFSGKCSGSQKEMQDLVKAHGGTVGTKSVFSLLIATPNEYDCESAKVLQAEIKEVPIVHETFLYDAIINGKEPDIEKYDLSKC